MMTRRKNPFEHICMLSTHGYFDPVPQLGRTDTGGQVVYVLQLAKSLSILGTAVDIYTRWFDRSKNQIDSVLGYPNVRVVRIPAGPWEFVPKEEIYETLPELAGNMVDFIGNNGLQYDLFHGHYVDAGIVTLNVARELGRPAFFTAHSIGAWKKEQMEGDPEEMEKKYRFNHRLSEELRIFESVTAQSVTTRLQEEKIEQLYGFTSDNIVVIPPGVDVHSFTPPQPGTKKAKDDLPEKYVLCLSRIDANKGHDLLLKAFDTVRKAVPEVHLVIAGGSPRPRQTELEVRAAMKKIIEEKKMHDSVHVIGYVADEVLAPLYGLAELFVLPSIFEPFGMTALEAMACGTPVVASKFGGIKNVITSEENGLLVDVSRPEEFAKIIVSLLTNRPLAQKLGERGYRTIHEHYSWEAIAERHITFYNKFMDV